MSPSAREAEVLIASAGSLTVNSSAPVSPRRTRRAPTTTRPWPREVAEPKTTSGIPSPFMSITLGVIDTSRSAGSTSEPVQAHWITGSNDPGGGTYSQARPEWERLSVSSVSGIAPSPSTMA